MLRFLTYAVSALCIVSFVSSAQSAEQKKNIKDREEKVCISSAMTVVPTTAVILAAGIAGIDRIVVRLHPSEPMDQYDAVLSRLSTAVEVIISEESDLAVDLARSIAAVGSNSTAMVTAAAAGLRTISYIPEGGRPCVLPHEDIAKIQDRSILAEELAKLVQG